LPVPAVPPLAPAELGTVVVGVVVPSAGAAGLPACAESTDCAMGPAPILNPATIDSAAAATAPDAMKRLRPNSILGAAIVPGSSGRDEVS
jgi:hypothetical protein